MIPNRKFGLFGGSFDPVHHGHLILAREALEQLGLERILFIPANISPHKTGSPPAPPALRVAMLKAAIDGNAAFSIETCELEREGPSYAIDTVRHLAAKHAGVDWTFLIGGDNVAALDTWKEIDALRGMVEFAVFTGRHPAGETGGWPRIDRRIDLSSSEIRNRIARGLPVRYFVPDAVDRLIAEHRLYLHDRL